MPKNPKGVARFFCRSQCTALKQRPILFFDDRSNASIIAFTLLSTFLLAAPTLHAISCREMLDTRGGYSASPSSQKADGVQPLTLPNLIALSPPRLPFPQGPNQNMDLQLDLVQQAMRGVPNQFRQMLPQGLLPVVRPTFISDAGVYKSRTAPLVPLYHHQVIDGVPMTTTLHVPPRALVDNLDRLFKSIVPANVQKVVFFLHGGGTLGTGGHVAYGPAAFMIKHGIAYIGIDLPGHAGGPSPITSPSHQAKWLNQIIDDLIAPAEVPIFIAGHSYGAEIALYMWRKNLISHNVTGVIAMSPPADPAPGAGIRERYQRLDEMFTFDPARTPPAEIELFKTLPLAGKISQTAQPHMAGFDLLHDWQVQPGNGALPLLLMIGEGDPLYVGQSETFKTQGEHPQVELLVYEGKRLHADGGRYIAGHLIQEVVNDETREDGSPHPFPGHVTPYVDTVLFIDRHSGRGFASRGNPASKTEVETEQNAADKASEASKKKKGKKKKSDPRSLWEKITHAWLHNFAFRVFAREWKVLITKTMTGQKDTLKEIGQELGRLKGLKPKEMSAQQREAHKADMKEAQEILVGTHVPASHPKAEQGHAWQRELAAQQEVLSDTRGQMKNVEKQLKQAEQALERVQGQAQVFLRLREEMPTPEPIARLEQKLRGLEKKFLQRSDETAQATMDHYAQIYEKHHPDEPVAGDLVPPEELVQKMVDFHRRWSPESLAARRRLQAEIEQAWLEHLASEYGADVASPLTEMLGLSRRIDALQAQVQSLAEEASIAQQKATQAQYNLVRTFSPYFEAQLVSFEALLDGDVKWEYMPPQALQALWADWLKLWKSRSTEPSNELY